MARPVKVTKKQRIAQIEGVLPRLDQRLQGVEKDYLGLLGQMKKLKAPLDPGPDLGPRLRTVEHNEQALRDHLKTLGPRLQRLETMPNYDQRISLLEARLTKLLEGPVMRGLDGRLETIEGYFRATVQLEQRLLALENKLKAVVPDFGALEARLEDRLRDLVRAELHQAEPAIKQKETDSNG